MQPFRAASSTAGAVLLTAEDVSSTLGLDVSTVYRMAADGRLPAVKIGRQWRFPERAIEQVLGDAWPSAGSDLVAEAVVSLAAELLGVMVALTDLEGRLLTAVAHPCERVRRAGPEEFQRCTREWRDLARRADLTPEFRVGPLGFECATAFVRSGDRLVSMVVAGGIAPVDDDLSVDLHRLDDSQRSAVLAALPRIAAIVAGRRAAP